MSIDKKEKSSENSEDFNSVLGAGALESLATNGYLVFIGGCIKESSSNA